MPFEQNDVIRNLLNRQQTRLIAIVEIGSVIGNLVGQVNKLCFQWGALVKKVFGKFRMLFHLVIVRVLNNSFADFKSKIEPAECSVANFEVLDDAQCVQVVIERKSVGAHGGIERLFSGVA